MDGRSPTFGSVHDTPYGPQYYAPAPRDPQSGIVSGDNRQPCGSTVDSQCWCGSGKGKVYDGQSDTFPCKTKPPDEGCPKWDQTFDFDVNVWGCVERPLDAVA